MTIRTIGLVSIAALGMFALSAAGMPQIVSGLDGTAMAQNGPPDHSNAGGNGGGNSGNNGNNGGSGNADNNGVPANNGNNGGGPPSWANNGGGGNDGIQNAYNNAGGNGNGNGPNNDNNDNFGNQVLVLDDAETQELLASGWGANVNDTLGFANHGQRVRTFVALARELGLSAQVGAHQANFGAPFENGLTDLQMALEDAQNAEVEFEETDVPATTTTALQAAVDDGLITPDQLTNLDLTDPTAVQNLINAALAAGPSTTDLENDLNTALTDYNNAYQLAVEERNDTIEEAEEDLAEAIAAVKPGDGPMNGWEVVPLDYNGDDIYDAQDIADFQADNP